jgi:aspartyl-tRNA(Asn)/glutamyl-tRNA(Gln) amidotransferase subunit A
MLISQLARQLREREISCMEIMEMCLERIEKLDPHLGAFRVVFRDEAFQHAEALQKMLDAGRPLGPLHGIPLAVKDLLDVAGEATCAGCKLLENNRAKRDAEVIRKLARAGMILVGKTHTVQFAYGGVGINTHYGTPRNPWAGDSYVPGGSSSGSGVAVAARMVPAALGTDTGGSVRIPSALCGITGLKPTFGRVSLSGVYPLSWTLDSVGPMALSVEDVAVLYEEMKMGEGDQGEWDNWPQDVPVWLKAGVEGMRLGIPESVFWEEVDSEVERLVMDGISVLRGLGAKIERLPFPVARKASEFARRGVILASEAYSVNRHWVEEHFGELDPFVSFRLARAKDLKAHEYAEARREMLSLREEAMEQFSRVDVLVVPTTRIPSVSLEEASSSIDEYAKINWAYLRNTSIGNVLNFCALSVPCGFTSGGLPVGLMIYGRPWEEKVVLRVGHAFQKATEWHSLEPKLQGLERH